MRQLLCVALLLLCFAHGGIASYAGFTWEWPKKPQELQRTYVPYLGQSEGFIDGSVTWKPIRIAVNAWNVLSAIQTCGNLKNGDDLYERFLNKVNPQFDRTICEAVENVSASAENAVRFFGRGVPWAIRLHAERLLVKRATGRLKVAEEDEDVLKGPCKGVAVPLEDRAYRVHNADVVLYVGLTTSEPITEICKYDKDGRPIVASIKLKPKHILRAFKTNVRLFAHEVAHAIGFDSILNKTRETSLERDGETGVTMRIGDEGVKMNLQKFWNCSSEVNVIKLERVGKDKNQLHFPKNVVTGELMSPYNGGMVYSPLSLAVFESTGYFKADFDKAEGAEKWKRTQKRRVCGELGQEE